LSPPPWSTFGITKKPLRDDVRVYHFPIFWPMEQKLINLKWFFNSKITHKNFEIKPTPIGIALR
jgi:hypothetical protein